MAKNHFLRRKWLGKILTIIIVAMGLFALTKMIELQPTFTGVKRQGYVTFSLVQNEEKIDIATENKKRGSTHWAITKPGASRLQGYASKVSVDQGDSITFFVHSRSPYRMEIYRMGYYQGAGACLVQETSRLLARRQVIVQDASRGCDWVPSYKLQVPQNWTSGFYLVKCIDAKGYESHIPFVVREKQPTADYAVLIATNTYHAYNNWGGKSLYAYNSTFSKQASSVSFNRPYSQYYGSGLFFQFEYNLIRFLEKEGYSLTYISDADIHDGILDRSKIKALIIAGHSEYWSMEMRKNIEKATATKINLANFCANVGYWQVRMEPDSMNHPNRLMTSYKQFALLQDPYRSSNPKRVTTRWRDNPVSMPEDQVLGIMYTGIPDGPSPLVVSNASHWLYKGTGVKNGDQIPGVVGGEVDAYHGRLKGVEIIASSPTILYGQKRNVHVAWYQKPTGGKVFSVGTFYWNWFLDSTLHTGNAHENAVIQQVTRNALRALIQ